MKFLINAIYSDIVSIFRRIPKHLVLRIIRAIGPRNSTPRVHRDLDSLRVRMLFSVTSVNRRAIHAPSLTGRDRGGILKNRQEAVLETGRPWFYRGQGPAWIQVGSARVSRSLKGCLKDTFRRMSTPDRAKNAISAHCVPITVTSGSLDTARLG